MFGASLWIGCTVRTIPNPEPPVSNNAYPMVREAMMDIVPPPAASQPSGDLTDAEVATHVEQNAETLEELHEAMSRPIQIPLGPGTIGKEPWRLVQRMWRLLRYELNYLASSERHEEAMTLSLQMLQFGQELTKHGYLIHAHIGRNFEGSALRYLVQRREQFTDQQFDEVLTKLEQLDPHIESYEAMYQRSVDNSAVMWGWRGRLSQVIPKSAKQKQRNRESRLFSYRYQALGRLLAIDIRIRNYRRNHGELPENLGLLGAPNEMLIDPYGNGLEPLGFLTSGDDYLLYSRGMDLEDNGGVSPKKSGWREEGDWLLGEFFYKN